MIHFINITEDEFLSSKILYKHMSLEKALRTLKNKTLWFANPATWHDPFEKRFIEAKYMHEGKEVPIYLSGRVFCSCMTQTQSSEAYWNMYSHGEIGIELRIKRDVLLKELDKHSSEFDIFIGRVEYLKTKEIKTNDLSRIPFNPPIKVDLYSNAFIARLFLLKRVSFKYEDEVRIIVLRKKNKAQASGIELGYTCDNVDLFSRIVLDPRLEDNTADVLDKCFSEDFNFKPYISGKTTVKRVLRSQLYTKQKPAVLYWD